MVDSSAWIQYFRRGEGIVSDAVDRLLEEDRALLCGVVEAEILQGLRCAERDKVADLLTALKYLDTERQDFLRAGKRLGELRRSGITIPLTDALIGALCSRHGVALLTLDRHFDHMPEVERFLEKP
jgi:predicted nucleic acid-binding protein